MTRLFTYTIPVDDGAAPNPFSGYCTLAICKPGIRRVAKVGDWVAGLGSINAPGGDLSGRLVYAMRVEEVLSLRDYDLQAPARWPSKIPNIHSNALQDRLGDCIYDYSSGSHKLRPSVHNYKNEKTDLRGENVLISKDFYYFGSRAVELPPNLLSIRHQTQGHRSNSNDPYVDEFISWIRTYPMIGQLYGWPDYIVDWSNNASCGSCDTRNSINEYDPAC